jgi:predicted transcriptional regulator of viral defense system
MSLEIGGIFRIITLENQDRVLTRKSTKYEIPAEEMPKVNINTLKEYKGKLNRITKNKYVFYVTERAEDLDISYEEDVAKSNLLKFSRIERT